MTSQLDLIRYRLERAGETLDDARLLANSERWNSCVNRLYYASFYAVSALLLTHGLKSSKHSGIRSLFNLHFVKTGRVSAEQGQIYNDLFRHRQRGDYMDLARFDEESVQLWASQSTSFVEAITALTLAELDETEEPGPSHEDEV